MLEHKCKKRLLTNPGKNYSAILYGEQEYILQLNRLEGQSQYYLCPLIFSGIMAKVLISFSVYTNGAKILSTHQAAGTLSAVNGIRFLSMAWIILGHTYGVANLEGGKVPRFHAQLS